MHSSLASPWTLSPGVRLAFIAALALLSSGWTCTAFFGFNSCQTQVWQGNVVSLLPDAISRDAQLVPLTVEGSDFTPRSQILWNGSSLETTFIDSHHLQTTITQETFELFGGSAGSGVLISVSQGTAGDNGCSKDGASSPRVLAIR